MSNSYKIEKLKGADNYQICAFKVKRVLVDKLGGHSILTQEPVEEVAKDNIESEEGKTFILWTSNN